jgi:hypothetical protein
LPQKIRETEINPLAKVAKTFVMTDEVWRRHANPWSVYTRFAAISGHDPFRLEPGLDWLLGALPHSFVIVWLWLK